jgi:hypothetical protein
MAENDVISKYNESAANNEGRRATKRIQDRLDWKALLGGYMSMKRPDKNFITSREEMLPQL